MRTPTYAAKALADFLRQEKIATLEQLRAALGHPARATVFRKLGELEYLSSYSHRGKYYTLRAIARFTRQGLWTCRSVWFSKFGNLLDTVVAFVEGSRAGYTAAELRAVLHVKTKHALAQLVHLGRLSRESMDSVYVYLSSDRKTARRQQEMRAAQAHRSTAALIVADPELAAEEAKAVILLFYSLLDEKQRRLYAGLESLKLGHGGDVHIASLLGIDPHTVARGRQELVAGEVLPGQVRAGGGGRPSLEKKRRKS
jgi:hypothetical protein